MRKYEIMGATCFQVETIDSSKSYIKGLIANNQGGYSTAINAEKIMMYSKDSEMKSILDNSVLPVPDGSGAVIGMKFLHGVFSIRLDLPKTIFELSNEEKYNLFILGSSEDINKKSVNELKIKYPNINIVGRHNGYFDDENTIIDLLKDLKPQIVMVALGSPKQEKFAAKINKILPNILFIGCGGALDILAGKITRAPKFFQDNHIEWLYRLTLEPKRIKRQKILPVYLFKLITETIKRKLIK
ncbi:MAG: WecB/TagA/CpsF family glycosyltransferase [Campylobacterota bacterium]|nr:WecB/TagA/CpsF family glycosyltransferase [Campylobacterota bacterium]